jgi:hypothetical protein
VISPDWLFFDLCLYVVSSLIVSRGLCAGLVVNSLDKGHCPAGVYEELERQAKHCHTERSEVPCWLSAERSGSVVTFM